MERNAWGKLIMWCSGLAAAITLVLYFTSKRNAEQSFIRGDVDGTPYWIALAVCAVAFITGSVFAARGDNGES